VPLQQRYKPQLTILARMASGQNATRAIGAAAASLNPKVSHISARRLDAQDGPVQVQLRVAASVAGSVGLIGVLLAALGIYGVTAHAVTQRTREIGIRIAMGADGRDIIAMVLGRSMALVAIGAVFCVLGSEP
jgi:putative ABC transport system permease protein